MDYIFVAKGVGNPIENYVLKLRTKAEYNYPLIMREKALQIQKKEN